MKTVDFFDGPYARTLKRADEVMRAKMADYAGAAQFSANFRRAAASAGLTPYQVWLVFADKHWGAITRFVREGRLESEGIEGRIVDLINYLLLLAGLVQEDDPTALRPI